jgi:putative polyketide hydroxylase
MRPYRTELADPDAEAHYHSVAMGYRYRSAAVVADAEDDGLATENPLHPTGRPGTRLAHIPVARNGNRMSSLDLTGGGFVLLAGAEGEAWVKAAECVSAGLGVDVAAYRLGADLVDGSNAFARAGLATAGAVLVRPDGYIAWRTTGNSADPAATLGDVLTRILFRSRSATARAA